MAGCRPGIHTLHVTCLYVKICIRIYLFYMYLLYLCLLHLLNLLIELSLMISKHAASSDEPSGEITPKAHTSEAAQALPRNISSFICLYLLIYMVQVCRPHPTPHPKGSGCTGVYMYRGGWSVTSGLPPAPPLWVGGACLYVHACMGVCMYLYVSMYVCIYGMPRPPMSLFLKRHRSLDHLKWGTPKPF